MRKGLVIGAIVVGVIGVAAWVFWESGKGTLEWHKRKYSDPTETTIWASGTVARGPSRVATSV